MKRSSLKSLISDILVEEWDKDVEIKSTGTHADKTIAQIKKEMESLKGKKPFNREKFSELMFALRAKQGWKKGKGATGTTENITMKKSEIKDFIQTELSELLSENTNSLNYAYVIYTKALKSFEQNANKLNDKVMLKIYKEFDKLHLKITQHLDANYEGSLDESYADTMQANLPRASFAELDEAKDALESLLRNTRNDRELLKLYKAHLKLTKVFQKHLDKNYPDWDKRMEENTKTINVRHKTTKKKLDIPDDPDTIKKYKKMGYSLWIGSRKKNESINERTELKQIIREIIDEDLRNWFKSKWVNIGKKDKDGKHPPCGTSGDKRGYAKCVPQATASKMSDKEKESATRRKRAAQNDVNRGGKESAGKNGKKPINVSTYTKKSGKKSGTGKGS